MKNFVSFLKNVAFPMFLLVAVLLVGQMLPYTLLNGINEALRVSSIKCADSVSVEEWTVMGKLQMGKRNDELYFIIEDKHDNSVQVRVTPKTYAYFREGDALQLETAYNKNFLGDTTVTIVEEMEIVVAS